jgi:hydroxymethylpyrimidine pyrophosphatase-like HAD family hydrolase
MIFNVLKDMKHLFLNPEFTYQRLLREYKQHGSIVIAVDFDNTLFDYHQSGLGCSEIVDLLQKLKSINCYIILWTASTALDFIQKYCATHHIPFDAINENPPFFKGDSRKIYYNELLDDRAGLRESFDRLTKLYKYLIAENQNHPLSILNIIH